MAVRTQLLKRFPFFQTLPPSDLRRLAAATTRHELAANTIVFQENDVGDAFYMIVTGDVEIYSQDGTIENRLNILHAGDWFGELALIDNQPRSGSARTLTHTVLLALPKAEFRYLVTSHPVALYTLVATTQQRLRERDRAYEAELRTRLRQLEQLHQTLLDITRHLDRAHALEAIRERAVELLRSAGGELYLYDNKQHLLVPQNPELPNVPNYRVGEGCTGRAFQAGRPQQQSGRNARFELAAPIKLVDRTGVERSLGVLCVFRAADGVPYASEDETLLSLFASQAAIVIENTELHNTRLAKERLDTELADAQRVQRSLIPSSAPHPPGYQIAALWHPAKQVSGDYYDFIPLENGRLALVLGDVSGKGLDAALFMANARSILRASAQMGGTPSEIIRHANNTVSEDSFEGMFVTMVFAILDPIAHTLTYVNAGHNHPYVWRTRSQLLEELGGGNRALGITPEYDYVSDEITLDHGDMVILYTDGVTEATAADGTLFGDRRLAELIRANAAATARQLTRELDSCVRTFTGSEPQSDDITVVIIRRV